MPVKDICTEQFQQHIFLGLSVSEVSASAGWSQQTTEVSISLIEDKCPSIDGKVCYDNSLTRQIVYTADPGFVGENRYQRSNGSQYSSCVPEDISDTLVRTKIDIIGMPAYFRLGNFEYAGIIVDYNKSVSSSGIVYRVKLTDPREILAGINLIIGDYTGALFQTGNINVYNVYGFMEQFGLPLPLIEQIAPCTYDNTLGTSTIDGAMFGSYSGGYGGSFVNERGMPLEIILQAFNVMANAVPPIHSTVIPFVGSPDGVTQIPYVSYYGQPVPYTGCGLIPENNPVHHLSYYQVDYSELPIVGGYLNRIEGTVISLLDIIEQAVTEAGMDYYIELVLVKDGSSIKKFIKIRVVDRTTPPSSNQICTYIENQNNVLSYDIGQELRIENTGAVIIGANKQSIYQSCTDSNPEGNAANTISSIAIDLNTLSWSNLSVVGCPEIDDMILPYFGLDSNGDFIVPCTGEYGWEFTISTENLQYLLLSTIVLPPTLTINEFQLRAALSGYEQFRTVNAAIDSDLWQTAFNDQIPLFEIQQDKDIQNAGKKAVGRDWVNPKKKKFTKLDFNPPERKKENDRQTIFDFYLKYAREYYGKKFAVRVPFTGCWPDYENRMPIISDTPTNDGGWTEVSNVIGLTTLSSDMQFFRNQEDKIVPFVKFSNSIVDTTLKVKNVSYLNEEQYLFAPEVGNPNGALYMKVDVDEEYIFHDKSLCYAPRVVVTLEEGVYDSYTIDDQVNIRLDALKKENDLGADDLSLVKVGGKEALLPLHKEMSIPDACAIPILSKTLTYGPFYYGGTGIPGKTNIVKDDYLAPWNYGSFSNMNSAGVYTASKTVTAMKSGELGSITVVGYPTIPLGAELGAIDAGAYPTDEYLLENRNVTLNVFSDVNAVGTTVNINFETVNLIAGPWSGTFGPNITNINVNISSSGGATTTYSMRTFAPRQRFLDRRLIDKITANKLEFRRVIRNQLFNLKQKFFKKQRLLKYLEQEKRALPKGDIQEPGTPHSVFCGQIVDVGGTYNRTLVTSSKLTEISFEMQEDYNQKAFMSIDGLLRPVSMDGRGDLPRYVVPNPIPHCQFFLTDSNCNITGVSSLSDDIIDINHLNPFSNPVEFNRSTVVTERSDTPNVGHDIEIVGRNGSEDGTPVGGMIMPLAGITSDYDGDYQDDYSIMALKGPLLVQQWGYDIDNKPVPNKIDTEENASIGVFATSGLTSKFMDNWLRKPNTWPVAPIDLRLDKERGVWVTRAIPDKDDIIVGVVCKKTSPIGNVWVEIEWPILEDASGDAITNNLVVYAYNFLAKRLEIGDRVILKKMYRDGAECHLIIEDFKESSNPCNTITRLFPFKVVDSCVGFEQEIITGQEITINSLGNIIEDDNNKKFNIHRMMYSTGPTPTGFRGWAVEIYTCNTGDIGSGDNSITGEAYLVDIEHYAKYIEVNDFDYPITVLKFWDGIEPSGNDIILDMGCYYDYSNTPSGCICATLTYVPEESECGSLLYRVLSVDDVLTFSANTNCITPGLVYPDRIYKRLEIGKGLAIRQKPTNDCYLQLGLAMPINDDPMAELEFSTSCFDLEPTGCRMKVSLASSIEDSIEVVLHPITCVSGEIHYDTAIIGIQCGLIVSII